MMNNIEILNEILSKDILSEEDRNRIASITGEDKQAEAYYNHYKKIEKTVRSASHLSDQEMTDYILYKNGIEPENKSIIKSLPAIEDHIRKCHTCFEDLKVFHEEYGELKNFISETFEPVKAEQPLRKFYPVQRYAFASLLIAGFLYAALLLFSAWTTPEHYKHASIDDRSEFFITRGRVTNEFQNSLKAFDNNRFDEAIEYLKKDIELSSADETVFYSHYILGLAYLETARKSFAGLFPSFDTGRVSLAIEQFGLAVLKNDSGKYPNINHNSYYYSAKAYLMLNDIESAKFYLRKVVDEKGSKMNEAIKLLSELE